MPTCCLVRTCWAPVHKEHMEPSAKSWKICWRCWDNLNWVNWHKSTPVMRLLRDSKYSNALHIFTSFLNTRKLNLISSGHWMRSFSSSTVFLANKSKIRRLAPNFTFLPTISTLSVAGLGHGMDGFPRHASIVPVDLNYEQDRNV